MSVQIYRVTVRGHFAELDAETRARLVADAAAHDGLQARFTADGTFVYDRPLVAFSFRYELRVDEERREDADLAASMEATERATNFLTTAGIGHGTLRAVADNLGDVWERTSGARPGPRRSRAGALVDPEPFGRTDSVGRRA